VKNRTRLATQDENHVDSHTNLEDEIIAGTSQEETKEGQKSQGSAALRTEEEHESLSPQQRVSLMRAMIRRYVELHAVIRYTATFTDS
jgi:hypothetical protein